MEGFNALENGRQVDVVSGITDMVVRVMINGRYTHRMAAAALLRSQEHTKGAADVHDTLFFKVCAWLDTNLVFSKVMGYNTAGALCAAIAADTGLSATGVRSCLAHHPFNIPDNLKPNKKKYMRYTAEPTPTPPTAIVPPPVPQLKPLKLVNELRSVLCTVQPSDVREKLLGLTADILREEIVEIERRLA